MKMGLNDIKNSEAVFKTDTTHKIKLPKLQHRKFNKTDQSVCDIAMIPGKNILPRSSESEIIFLNGAKRSTSCSEDLILVLNKLTTRDNLRKDAYGNEITKTLKKQRVSFKDIINKTNNLVEVILIENFTEYEKRDKIECGCKCLIF